jgi:glycosyltransferase involved in cell wall biosynthesis
MSRGCVVVASDNGGMRDIIDDGRTGFLVRTGDCSGLADRCIRLLRDPSEMQQVSLDARDRAVEFSWNRVAAETLSFYERLLR